MSPLRRIVEASQTPLIRGRVLMGVWVLSLLGLMVRAGELQLAHADTWRMEADRQHHGTGSIPAARGSILDRTGSPLAFSHETFRIGVAPHELRDRAVAAAKLVEVLGVSEADARRFTESEARWVVVPGRYPARAREALSGLRGVHVEREVRRAHPRDDLARGVLGAVIDGAGAGGIEQAFDAHLQGTPGSVVVARDAAGRPIPGERWVLSEPRAGGDLLLTIDRDLQEIVEDALLDAVEKTGARGGDVLVTDPRTGEILAMASLVDGSLNNLGGITTPFEPGSTLKPFTVAGLLQLQRVSMLDSVDTEDGRIRVAGRTISDVSRVGKVTLTHALRVSSNVAMVKVAEAYSPAEQYEFLRDFGFGVATGVPLPGEAGGLLRAPRGWSRQSAASLAIGYEINVTPLQLAMAYGALANGGILMEPRLVREIRGPDGQTLERFEPRAVRRVVSPEVASAVNQSLIDAVQSGTGQNARLATFEVAGKSGTARAVGADGRYENGAYQASFVGFFPADAPQLVVFVKLDRPQGAYYGGATAAPVTRATMEAVLAARRPPLDRNALAAIARAQEAADLEAQWAAAMAEHEATDSGPAPLAPSFLAPRSGNGIPALFASMARVEEGARRTQERPVPADGSRIILPDLQGFTPREAVRRLHALGLTVVWEGEGQVRRTYPAAGASVSPGDSIRIVAAPPAPGSGSR
jgi:cell division protein FtsI (penicillin-binding protein 3)